LDGVPQVGHQRVWNVDARVNATSR
jgi:hypothetical protein